MKYILFNYKRSISYIFKFRIPLRGLRMLLCSLRKETTCLNPRHSSEGWNPQSIDRCYYRQRLPALSHFPDSYQFV